MDAAAPTQTITITAPKPAEPKSHFWAGHGFSFHDVLDAINPLQHLPVIGTLYRSLTGDTIGNVARIVGDGLFGGPLGLASGVADTVLAETTGKDMGAHIMATLGLTHDDAPTAETPGATGASPSGPVSGPMPSAAPVAVSSASPYTAAPQNRSILPQLGSSSTAGLLAAAAPVTAATVATSGIQFPQKSGIAIDPSPQGIARMRGQSLAHNPQAVPLQLPPGTLSPTQAAPRPSIAPGDFVQKMQEGLDRYAALMSAKLPRGEAFDTAQ